MADPPLPRPADAAWAPNSRPQEAFLRCGGYEALYGGAAGGGKSAALLAGALRYVDRPTYCGIIFRRHFPALERTLVPRALELYPHAGGTYHRGDHLWSFPSGARVYLAHLKDDAAALSHKSSEYQYVAFDELTSFTRFQYTYLLSRGRTTDPTIPIRIRAGTNPGDIGHEWVRSRWAPWLDTRPEYTGMRAAPGQTLHYLPGTEGEPDVYVPATELGALSRAFFPALATDNPDLMRSDPGYLTRLDALDRVSRAQLKGGDWAVKPGKGEFFKREWWRYRDCAPAKASRKVRSWDLAATTDGDWTVGALYSHAPDEEQPFIIEDVIRFRGTPHVVEKAIKDAAERDGRGVDILLPIDPGQAGVAQAEGFKRLLPGYVLKCIRPAGDKVARARHESSAVENGLVALVRGGWNHQWVEEHQDFPTKGVPDDCIDAGDQGFNELTGVAPSDLEGWAQSLAGIRVGRPEAPARGGSIWLPDEDDDSDFAFTRRD